MIMRDRGLRIIQSVGRREVIQMKTVVVYRIVGNQEDGEKIVETMERTMKLPEPEPLKPDEIKMVKDEWERIAHRMRVAMHPEPVDYKTKVTKVKGQYGRYLVEPSSARRFYNRILGVYGLLILIIVDEFERLSAAWRG